MQRIRAACDSCAGNHDELQMTLDTLGLYHPDSHPCQRCGKQVWSSRKTSSYRRSITYVREGKRIDDECMIPVFLCPECGKSDRPGGSPNGDYYHAIFTDNLIPFTYFTLLFVLTVLDDYARRTRPVADICEYWSISVSMLYRWKKRYKDHYDAWAESMDHIRKLQEESEKSTPEEAEAEAIGKSLCRVFSVLTQLPADFFSRFRFSFLQPNHLTHFRPLASERLDFLKQRVTSHYNFTGLTNEEISSYITHKLAFAGGSDILIDEEAVHLLCESSQGISHTIDHIMSDALRWGIQMSRVDGGIAPSAPHRNPDVRLSRIRLFTRLIN